MRFTRGQQVEATYMFDVLGSVFLAFMSLSLWKMLKWRSSSRSEFFPASSTELIRRRILGSTLHTKASCRTVTPTRCDGHPRRDQDKSTAQQEGDDSIPSPSYHTLRATPSASQRDIRDLSTPNANQHQQDTNTEDR